MVNISNSEIEVYNSLWEKIELYQDSKSFVSNKLFQNFRKDLNKITGEESMKKLNVWLKPFLSGAHIALSHFRRFFDESKSDLLSLVLREIDDLTEYAKVSLSGWTNDMNARVLRSVKETVLVILFYSFILSDVHNLTQMFIRESHSFLVQILRVCKIVPGN